MLQVSDFLKINEAAQEAQAQPQPQVVYRRGGSGLWPLVALLAMLVASGMYLLRDTPISITHDLGQVVATVRPAGGYTVPARPTAVISVPQVQEAPVVVPQADAIIVAQPVPTLEPAVAPVVPDAAPVAEPVQDLIVEPTPAAAPQYQLDPSVPHPELAARTDGEFQGWGGGGGSGWQIPEPKADTQAHTLAAQQPTSAPKPTEKPVGWGGGGGSGWDVPPAADNGGWSVGN